MPHATLTDFITPISPDNFLTEIFSKKPLYIKGQDRRFEYLLPWEDLNELLHAHWLEPPRLRLVKHGADIPSEKYMRPPAFIQRAHRTQKYQIDLKCFSELLRDGAMLIIDDIEDMHQPIRSLCKMLEREFGDQVTANMYAGWHATQGFDTHWDDHDVIIVQVSGVKHWRVFEPQRKCAITSDRQAYRTPPQGVPNWEGDLWAGDLLHIPRGWWHDAVPVEQQRTLHLTITIVRRTGLDLTQKLAESLKDFEIVRTDLPRFGTKSDKSAYLTEYRHAIDACLSRLSIDSYFDEVDALAATRQRPSFPWTAAVNGDHVPHDAWVHWLPPRKSVVQEIDGMIKIDTLASTFTFNESTVAAPILRTLANDVAVRVYQLSQAHPHIAADVLEEFLFELVSKGLISISETEAI